MGCLSVICKLAMKWYQMRMCISWLCPLTISFPEPAYHLVSTKRRSSGIINFQSFRFLYLGVPVSRRLRTCVPCLTSRDKVDVDVFHRDIQYALEKHIVEVENWLWKNSSIKFWKQKTRGLWERDCLLFQNSLSWRWPKDTWALETRLVPSMKKKTK